jgi:rhodanese-related sulfurtransferase
MMASAKEGVMRKVSAVVLAVLVAIALASCSGDDGSGTPDGPGWTRLSPEGLQDLMSSEDVYLVNVHVPFEGEITGTDVHIPYTDLVDRLGELPAEGAQTLVLYCRSGNMSTAAAQDLVAAGRTGFFELDGGFVAWNEAGLPFEP